MSWQDLVNNNLVGTGVVTKGAIVGHDGTVWGISPGFSVSFAIIRRCNVRVRVVVISGGVASGGKRLRDKRCTARLWSKV